MKKTLILLSAIFILHSCKDPKNETVKPEEKTQTETPKPNLEPASIDWENTPISTADIGSFPYITAPESFFVMDEYGSDSKTGMTSQKDHDKLISFNGKSFIESVGKRAYMWIGMKEKQAFNQSLFDESVEEYLNTIGAVSIFKGQIPREMIDELNKADEKTAYNYITGDVWNSAPVRHYVLNHKTGKIIFQVWSNTAQAKIGVLEIEK